MSVGRYFCVALPFILTAASIICMLIVGLAGVVDSNSLYEFQINTTDLAVNPEQIATLIDGAADIENGNWVENLKNKVGLKRSPEIQVEARANADDLINTVTNTLSDTDIEKIANDLINNGANITAEDLGLFKLYDVSMWGYCGTTYDNKPKKNCTEARFNWAQEELNLNAIMQLSEVAGFAGVNITVPDEVKQGLQLFKTVSKWTQIVYCIAMGLLAIELVVGLFSACSRAVSCVVWVFSGLATAAVIATGALVTATASVVVGVSESVGQAYGLQGSINTSFLAAVWIGAAFALGASLFWLFSVCCCKPEHRAHKSSRGVDAEKFGGMSRSGSAYHPIGEQQQNNSAQYNYGFHPQQQRGGARSDLAYEPYSHS